MDWILDCSFASAFFLPDESTPAIDNFFRKEKKKNNFFVPALWWYELSNVLLVSIKRKRLQYSDAIRIFSLFEEFDIKTENNINDNISRSIFELSCQHKVSAYDAAYLELAVRKNASLASLDNDLNKIATKCGIRTFNPAL